MAATTACCPATAAGHCLYQSPWTGREAASWVLVASSAGPDGGRGRALLNCFGTLTTCSFLKCRREGSARRLEECAGGPCSVEYRQRHLRSEKSGYELVNPNLRRHLASAARNAWSKRATGLLSTESHRYHTRYKPTATAAPRAPPSPPRPDSAARGFPRRASARSPRTRAPTRG